MDRRWYVAGGGGVCSDKQSPTTGSHHYWPRNAPPRYTPGRICATTAPGDPKLLANLWTEDAVRINPGGRVEVGRAAIRAADERTTVRHPQGQVLTYVPTIKDLRITGEWAFEWGTFNASYRDSAAAEVQKVKGTVLRVLRKQPDGTWKFARVMTQVE